MHKQESAAASCRAAAERQLADAEAARMAADVVRGTTERARRFVARREKKCETPCCFWFVQEAAARAVVDRKAADAAASRSQAVRVHLCASRLNVLCHHYISRVGGQDAAATASEKAAAEAAIAAAAMV